MNADIRWIDNPEIFRVNQIAAHSDHDYFTNYEALNSNSHNLIQSLNGQWKFCFSRNAMSRPADFYKEDYDTSYFDKIMVPGHIELAVMIRFVISIPCILGKVRPTEGVLTV